ncbi:MAG: hypothetical protein IJ094_05480 [Bacilli bacterium]|nr:hypothetical protein [Bacilli bacterium]
MEKRRKIKVITIVALVAGLLAITVAFAALSGTLKINGSGKMDPANWDIHFKNVRFESKTDNATINSEPTPTNDNKGVTIDNLSVTLKQPGDYVEYTADIENEGDIDAKIDVITPPELTSKQQEIFEFKVEYTDPQTKGTKVIEHGDLLRAGETKNVTIKFSYKDITDEKLLPKTIEEIRLSYSINFVQYDGKGNDEIAGSIESTGSTCTSFAKKDTYSSGDVIVLCNTSTNKSEDFYVLTDNGDTVTALAKYNLLVGNKNTINPDDGSVISSEDIPTSDPEYGIQSSKTVLDLENFVATGAMLFSENNYWGTATNYGNNYPVFVFDSNSYLWQPVQNYQSYLRNTLGKTSVNATLLSHEQALANGCGKYGISCSGFIAETSFWSGTAPTSDKYIVAFHPFGGFYGGVHNTNGYLGVRPVITINKSEL